MNRYIFLILNFFGLAKEEWHYTHGTYSQHIIEYFTRVVDPHKRLDPYALKPIITDKPIKVTTIGELEAYMYGATHNGTNWESGGDTHLGGVPTRPDWERYYKNGGH